MNISSIKDLLMSNGYPIAYIQGHHTRIVMNDDGIYRVLRRENSENINSVYIVNVYEGESEMFAVQHFINSENS